MWTTDGDKWEYQVRADCGSGIFSEWTDIVSAVAHPRTAPGPKNIVTRPTNGGLRITWDSPDVECDIDRYGVHLIDSDAPGSFPMVVGFKETSATIDGLTIGHRYGVAIATWTDAGGGIPAGANAVRVGYATPPAPTDLHAFTQDPTTVRLVWTGSSGAAGYRIWIRNITDESDEFKPDPHPADQECREIGFLFPGTWNFMFYVTAFNGDLESERSEIVAAPRTIDEGPDWTAPHKLHQNGSSENPRDAQNDYSRDHDGSQVPLAS